MLDRGYSVVYDWGGHGIGKSLHEDPSVPHRGEGGHGLALRPGMVFTVEPMINAGGPDWVMLRDGWTVWLVLERLLAGGDRDLCMTAIDTPVYRAVQLAGELSAAPGPGGKPICEWLTRAHWLTRSG